jgi:hypothetical protein
MEELIKQAFLHVDVIGPHVHEGHYDLIGPNGEIILPQVWETMIEPDWAVTMHMWPMPEPRAGPPPGQGHHVHPRDRPQSRHGPIPGRGPPNGPPPRPGPPPPPPGWVGGQPPRPPPGHGVGGPAVIVMSNNGKPRRSKTEPPKGGLMGWMAGKPTKSSSSGKGERIVSNQ